MFGRISIFAQGAFTNSVNRIWDNFYPPPPLWMDMNILMTPLKNYVNIWWPPLPFYTAHKQYS